jgi:hypothetical protein
MIVLSLDTSQKMEAMIQQRWQKCGFERTFLPTFQLKAIEVNAESPLFIVNHDLEENVEEEDVFDPTILLMNVVEECLDANVEEEDVFDPTIPLMNVVEECLDANVEAPTSSFVHGATTKKKNNTSIKIDVRGKQKTLT